MTIDTVIAFVLGVLFGAPLVLFVLALAACAKAGSEDGDERETMREM